MEKTRKFMAAFENCIVYLIFSEIYLCTGHFILKILNLNSNGALGQLKIRRKTAFGLKFNPFMCKVVSDDLGG